MTGISTQQYSITEFKCNNGWTKCKDNMQCIPRNEICNGRTSCKDRSDEDPDFLQRLCVYIRTVLMIWTILL